jgi:hypothetical protein
MSSLTTTSAWLRTRSLRCWTTRGDAGYARAKKVARALVYNPLAFAQQDVVEATVSLADTRDDHGPTIRE